MHISNVAAKHSNEGANELQEMQNKGHEDCLQKKKKKKRKIDEDVEFDIFWVFVFLSFI